MQLHPIIHKFPRDWTHVNIYGISDLHIGAPDCNLTKFRQWRKTVLEDPQGYVVVAGDMINNGIKDSKTNSYEETMNPEAQIDVCVEEMRPLAEAGRILAWVPGNHETRSWRQVAHNPAREICIRLNILPLFRREIAFVKINVGAYDKKSQQAYGLLISHGSSRLRHNKFCVAIEGVDCFISGHTHQPHILPMCRLKFNLTHESVSVVPYKEVVLPAFLEPGGYALVHEYAPQSCQDIPQVTLSGSHKKVSAAFI